VPRLTKLLKDDERVREAAADALKAIDPTAAKAADVP
jgi:HEAT repeat protein